MAKISVMRRDLRVIISRFPLRFSLLLDFVFMPPHLHLSMYNINRTFWIFFYILPDFLSVIRGFTVPPRNMSKALEQIIIDIDFFPQPRSRYKYVLVITDMFSKLVRLAPSARKM